MSFLFQMIPISISDKKLQDWQRTISRFIYSGGKNLRVNILKKHSKEKDTTICQS